MYQLKNFSSGTLKTAISAVDVQLEVESGHNLPTSGSFVVVVWDQDVYPNPADDPTVEVMVAQYSGSGNVFNITRAQESTSAVDHAAGQPVALHLTAGIMTSERDILGSYEVDEAGAANGEVLLLAGGKLSYSSALTLTGLTISTFGTPGFVKNDGSGILSGGNSLSVGDLPAHASTHESGGSDLVNHDSLAGFLADEHVAHSGVSISAGGILSGGGTIDANRTISLAHSDVDHDQTTNTHQDVKTSASPTFAGLTTSGNVTIQNTSGGLYIQTNGGTGRWRLLGLQEELQDGLEEAVISYGGAIGGGSWPFDSYGALVLQGRSDGVSTNGGLAVAPSTAAVGITFVVREDGKVGIGTTAPNTELEVDGTIRANTAFNLNGTDGVSDSDAGVPTALTVSGGIITSVTKNDWLDQSVKTTASPVFESLALRQANTTDLQLYIQNTESSSARYPGFVVENYDGASLGGHPVCGLRIAEGTRTSPTISAANRSCGVFVWQAYDGTNFTEVARIGAFTSSTFAADDKSGYLSFYARAHGESTSESLKAYLNNDGLFHVLGTVRADTAFNLNGTDIVDSDGFYFSRTATHATGYAYPQQPLRIEHIVSATGSGAYAYTSGVFANMRIQGSTYSNLGQYSGIESWVSHEADTTSQELIALEGEYRHFGEGDVSNAYGIYGSAYSPNQASLGAVTNLALIAGIFDLSGGITGGLTVSNTYGIKVGGSIGSGDTLTKFYGVYLEPPSGGTITTSYGVVVSNAAGNSGFGITAPLEKVHSSAKVRADTAFNLNGTDGVSDSDAGVPTALTTSGGIVTAITKNDWLNQSVKTTADVSFNSIYTSAGAEFTGTMTEIRPVGDTSLAESIRIGRSGSDIRYHSIYQSCSSVGNSYLQFRIHDGGGPPFTGQNTVLTLYGATPEAYVSGLMRATGKVRSDTAFNLDGADVITASSFLLYGPGTLGDGGTTNYTSIAADGKLTFHGTATVWDDVNAGGKILAGAPGQQPDTDEFVDNTGTDTGISTHAIAVGEAVDGSFEIPHGYKNGSDMYFHVHWQGIAAPTGTDNVQWQLTYCIVDSDEVVSASTTITIETGFDTQYEMKRSDFAAISGSGVEFGNQFVFRLERIAATTDEYGGDALLATVGLHYEIDTVGSNTIASK